MGQPEGMKPGIENVHEEKYPPFHHPKTPDVSVPELVIPCLLRNSVSSVSSLCPVSHPLRQNRHPGAFGEHLQRLEPVGREAHQGFILALDQNARCDQPTTGLGDLGHAG